MLGINCKPAVVSTFERVHAATGGAFGSLTVHWGRGAAVQHTVGGTTLILPEIDDLAEVSKAQFNDYIGYALHELGHVWFTQSAPWETARFRHGELVSNLINGLEDPRIERCVIRSGYADNAKSLFEALVNNVLTRGGYVHPDDVNNIPFQLAIEGRRLNGYQIGVKPVWQKSIWKDAIGEALTAAHAAKNTAEIVDIAIRLAERLQQKPQDERKQDGQDERKQDGQDGKQGDQQDEQDGKQDGQDGGQQDGDQDGQDGQDGESGGKSDGKPDGESADESAGAGSFGEIRPVEPRDLIAKTGILTTRVTPILANVKRRKIQWEVA